MTGTEQFIIDNMLVILYIPIAILFVAFAAAIIKERKDKNE
jgi:hypothetical protein